MAMQKGLLRDDSGCVDFNVLPLTRLIPSDALAYNYRSDELLTALRHATDADPIPHTSNPWLPPLPATSLTPLPSARLLVGVQVIADAAAARLLEPLEVKLELLQAVLSCLSQLIRMESVLSARHRIPAISRSRRDCSPSESELDSQSDSEDEIGTS